MLRSLCYVAPKCRSILCQRLQLRLLSSDDKKSRNITTMFGDIVIEYEPFRVRSILLIINLKS